MANMIDLDLKAAQKFINGGVAAMDAGNSCRPHAVIIVLNSYVFN